jgi:hypothetical protein
MKRVDPATKLLITRRESVREDCGCCRDIANRKIRLCFAAPRRSLAELFESRTKFKATATELRGIGVECTLKQLWTCGLPVATQAGGSPCTPLSYVRFATDRIVVQLS